MDYHLSIAGERSGPHTQFHIIQGIREGRLKGDELVWHVGLPEWQPLRGLNEFEGFWPLSEETLLQAEKARRLARLELDRPRPWLRFWARTFDRFWFFVAFGFAIGPFLPASSQDWADNTLLRYFLVPVMLLIYVPLEAWLLSSFGSTPGRALLRVQVRRLDGGLPVYSQALRRSFEVYWKGLALGLPFISLVAMLWARQTLLQRGITPWDETNETRVEHGEPEPWRYLVLAGIILGIAITAMLVIGQLTEEMSRLPK